MNFEFRFKQQTVVVTVTSKSASESSSSDDTGEHMNKSKMYEGIKLWPNLPSSVS